MENNENKQVGGFDKSNRRRNPRHKNKHFRNRNNINRNENQPTENSSQNDSITMRQGRYDLPPSEPQTYEISNASPSADRAPAKRHGYRPHHQKRRSNFKNRQNRNAEVNADAIIKDELAENVEANTTAVSENNFEAPQEGILHEKIKTTVSEYTLQVGENAEESEEILAEINSVTTDEAEAIESADTCCNGECGESAENENLETYEVVGVRFKLGGKVYYFAANSNILAKGDAIIVDTARGIEYGICEISNKTVTERDIVPPLRNVIRKATEEDIKRHEVCVAHEKEAAEIFSQKIIEHNLGMKLIDVEYAFDGSKLLFYFTAEGRVDFRELVKDLASIFRLRIELRQIGIRDETKLLGGIGLCGRPFCCKTFLPDFVQVSIKMAKEQNLSLNSQKISGACGRLMCCLRYEYETYQEEIKKTPKVDQIVSTPDGDGTVIEVQPLAGLVRVRFGSKADMIPPKMYHRDEVTVIGGKGVKPQEPEQD